MARLLTINEACDALKIGRTRIYEMIRSGQIMSVAIGVRGRRIPADEVERIASMGIDKDVDLEWRRGNGRRGRIR